MNREPCGTVALGFKSLGKSVYIFKLPVLNGKQARCLYNSYVFVFQYFLACPVISRTIVIQIVSAWRDVADQHVRDAWVLPKTALVSHM